MKQELSYQMGNGHIVKKSTGNTSPLNLVQAFLYASFGGFSVKEILEGKRI